jgi:hypothetical protein
MDILVPSILVAVAVEDVVVLKVLLVLLDLVVLVVAVLLSFLIRKDLLLPLQVVEEPQQLQQLVQKQLSQISQDLQMVCTGLPQQVVLVLN